MQLILVHSQWKHGNSVCTLAGIPARSPWMMLHKNRWECTIRGTGNGPDSRLFVRTKGRGSISHRGTRSMVISYIWRLNWHQQYQASMHPADDFPTKTNHCTVFDMRYSYCYSDSSRLLLAWNSSLYSDLPGSSCAAALPILLHDVRMLGCTAATTRTKILRVGYRLGYVYLARNHMLWKGDHKLPLTAITSL